VTFLCINSMAGGSSNHFHSSLCLLCCNEGIVRVVLDTADSQVSTLQLLSFYPLPQITKSTRIIYKSTPQGEVLGLPT